jgi:maltooligosyltrehalose trehalohydrolase
VCGEVPDPQDPATFEASRLDWSEPGSAPHKRLLDTYQDLIALRGDPALAVDDLRSTTCEHPGAATWFAVHRGDLTLIVNLTAAPVTAPLHGTPVLQWDPPTLGRDFVTLPGHSFVVLRGPAAPSSP